MFWRSETKPHVVFYLVRHGESEANIDSSLYTQKPDAKVELTARGYQQAIATGKFLRTHFEQFSTRGRPAFMFSSYLRARQTMQGIYDQLTDLRPKVKEYDGLVEQDFGAAQVYGNDEGALREAHPAHGAMYDLHVQGGAKHFGKRLDGESRMNVFVRGELAITSAHREFEQHGTRTFIMVCHSVTVRMLAKKLLSLPYEASDAEPGPDNGAVRMIARPSDPILLTSRFARTAQRIWTPDAKPYEDYGYIWSDGIKRKPELVPHERSGAMVAKGAYRWQPK